LYIGELAALSAAILWSFTGFVFSAASNRIGATTVNISRLISASVLLAIVILLSGVDYSLSSYQIYLLALSGLIGLAIGDQFLFKSYEEIGPRYGMLLLSSNPVLSAFLGFLVLGEAMSICSLVGIAVTIGGIALVVLEDTAEGTTKFKMTRKGLIFGILAAAGQATGLLLSKMAFEAGSLHWLVGTFARIASSALMMLPFVLYAKGSKVFAVFLKDKRALLLVFVGSIIGPFLGISSSFIAIMHAKIGVASTIMALPPIFMLPMSHYFHKEKLSWKAIAGAFIAVGGVIMLFLFD
jgi:drug/metabolite transporter (DMT)-like permease